LNNTQALNNFTPVPEQHFTGLYGYIEVLRQFAPLGDMVSFSAFLSSLFLKREKVSWLHITSGCYEEEKNVIVTGNRTMMKLLALLRHV
jgi:hypothetical protein